MVAIDYLIISHYHVDYETLIKLNDKSKKVICGLGVDADFKAWGFQLDNVLEEDLDKTIGFSDVFLFTPLQLGIFGQGIYQKQYPLDEHDELTLMKLCCWGNGVDTNKICIDYADFDSYSIMCRAKHIFKVDTAILVSQKYHLNRCVYIGDKLDIKSYGYSANQVVYPEYKYYSFREKLSINKCVFDVMRNRKPKYLGEPVNISGASNYIKDQTK